MELWRWAEAARRVTCPDALCKGHKALHIIERRRRYRRSCMASLFVAVGAFFVAVCMIREVIKLIKEGEEQRRYLARARCRGSSAYEIVIE